jgi:UPF0755 protein
MRKRISILVTGILGLTLILGLAWVGCDSPPPEGEPVAFIIPSGASFRSVVDTLQARGLVGQRFLFDRYARFKGADTRIKSGPYALVPGTSWSRILTTLTEGRVQTEQMTIPEGFRLAQMAPRIADITVLEADTVLAWLTADSLDAVWEVPGPGLEGYLFPDSYYLARGVPLTVVTRAMVDRYHAFWTPERVARRDSLGMTEREVVTLASIVQAEARVVEEMPRISSVYHNRLERGQLLQADPTVLYALGGYRARLLYAAMDSVADHPYNTYTQPGLPPGPIGAPGESALSAALYPEDSDFLYFMARTDGTHIFSRTLAEHNRAVASMRPEWERYRQEQGEGRR